VTRPSLEPLFSDLTHLFEPRSIVLVGASARPDSVGGRTLDNLVDASDFHGALYLVNPTRDEIAGRKCYRSLADLPEAPDVAIVTVPAAAAVQALEEAGDIGVRFAVVLSSGFGETGEDGEALEAQMLAIVRRTGMRIYGPNCPGLINIKTRLGMSFSPAFRDDLRAGPIGLATQGGGLGRTFLQAMERGIGVGLWASAGNQTDLEVSDFIHYMANAPEIRVIVVLLEGFKDGRKFIAALQAAAAAGKPVVALKVGKSEYGKRAAQSHTASMTGSAEINSTMLRQFGVIEVEDIDELIDTSWLLARKLPHGDEKIAIFASSGGAATLAADMVGNAGLELASFSADTTAELAGLLPSYAAIGNPVDVGTEIFTRPTLVNETLGAVARDPDVGLIIYTFPLDYGAVMAQNATSTVDVQNAVDTLILPVWMSDRLGDGYRIFVEAGIAPPRSLSKAVRAIQLWIEWGRMRRTLDPAFAPAMPWRVDDSTELVGLTEGQGKALLADAGITVLSIGLAQCADEAVQLANAMGYPVVAKVSSLQITHKSDVGGVKVGLADEAELRAAFETIMTNVRQARPDAAVDGMLVERMAPPGGVEVFVGVQRDPLFGHVMTFGLGGIHVEIFKDVSRRMLPLTPKSAREMIEEIRSFALLDGARGKPRSDVDALVDLLLAVSRFVESRAETLVEVDLNPVWVGARGEGAMPLDAVILERPQSHELAGPT
jgi:acyl-CoA synthetase (NDP forming)